MVDLRFLQDRDGHGHYRRKVDVNYNTLRKLSHWYVRVSIFIRHFLTDYLPAEDRGHRDRLRMCADRLLSQLSFSSLSLASYVWLV
jgi:hypothetical protein